MKKTLIIGDSFVEGVGAPVNKGWASLFKEYLCDDEVVVSGEGGDTTQKLVQRFPSIFYNNYIVQIGTNDSRYRPSIKACEVSPNEFKQNLAKITRRIKNMNQTANVTFVGLLFVDEVKTVPYKEDKIYKNTLLRQYDNYLSEFCASSSFTFITLESMFGKLEFLSDGLHPSESGHKEIFNLVKQGIL